MQWFVWKRRQVKGSWICASWCDAKTLRLQLFPTLKLNKISSNSFVSFVPPITFFFFFLPLSMILSRRLSSHSSPPLCLALSLSMSLPFSSLLSISLNISKEWITPGCHLALAKNSFLWVKCFKLSSLTGTISYNNYMDGPWLGVLSFFPPPLFIYMLKRPRLLLVRRGGRDGEIGKV